MPRTKPRPDLATADRELAVRIGGRLRALRLRAGMSQQQLAADRYTKAYVSAIEKGLACPSMRAIEHLAARLGVPAGRLIDEPGDAAWLRLEAEVELAGGEAGAALDRLDGLLAGASDRSTRAELQAARAEALVSLGRWQEAIAAGTEAAEAFAALGRPVEAALAELWVGCALDGGGRPAEAAAILRPLADRARAGLALDPDRRVRLLVVLAAIASGSGDEHQAISLLEEARAVAADPDPLRRGAALRARAATQRAAGDMKAAIRTGTEALALLRAASADRDRRLCDNDLALAVLALGETDSAARHAAAARSGLAGDPWLLAHVADTEAQIALARGELDRASALAAEAIEAARGGNNEGALAAALVTAARIATRAGRGVEAATARSGPVAPARRAHRAG